MIGQQTRLDRLTSKMLFGIMEQVPFFWKFSVAEKNSLVEDTGRYFASFEAGEAIIREGAGDNTLFILLEGACVITKNRSPDKVIARLERGAIFGEVSFLTQRVRTTNVKAAEKSVVFKIDGQTFDHLNPIMQVKFQHQLILILVERLDQMNESLLRWIR